MADTFNANPADGIPGYRGIVYGPSGRLILPGKLLHRQEASGFLGAAGATYTPPGGFAAAGSLTYTDPATDLPRVHMRTAAKTTDKASLLTTVAVALGVYKAIRIDVEAFSFLTNAPKANIRVGALGPAGFTGILQRATDESATLTSGGESNRTLGDESSILGPFATQRQQLSVLIVPGAREVFYLEDDMLRLWRAGGSQWGDGRVSLGVQIENTTAASNACRFASMQVSYYA
jgi:hypothetical protein